GAELLRRTPDRLLGRVSEELLGAPVPGGQSAVARGRDDRHRRLVDQLRARDARMCGLRGLHLPPPRPAGAHSSPLSADDMRHPSAAPNRCQSRFSPPPGSGVTCSSVAAIDGTVSLRVLGAAPAAAVAEPVLLALGARA